MKTKRFLLAVAFATMVFTFFACSSDDPDDAGSSNLSDLPTQAYFADFERDVPELEKYEGDGDIVVLLREFEEDYNTLPAGKIQNGQVSLNLPVNIDSKYLKKLEFGDEDCQGSISGISEKLLVYGDASLSAISDESSCRIRLYQVKSGKISGANEGKFFYFSESGSITGTCTRSGDRTYQTTYNMNFSKGWNLVYENDDHSFTTELPKGGTLLWGLRSCL